MQPVDRKRGIRRADSKRQSQNRALRNRYHRGARASEYTKLKILRGFADEKTVQDLASEMRVSEKTIRNIYMRFRHKLVTATLANPMDLGGAGLFLFHGRQLSQTGHMFVKEVARSEIYGVHIRRHAPRIANRPDRRYHLFEVCVRIFCHISVDMRTEHVHEPETLAALDAVLELGESIRGKREDLVSCTNHGMIVTRCGAVAEHMVRRIDMDRLNHLAASSNEHHYPETVLYDHLRRYIRNDPL